MALQIAVPFSFKSKSDERTHRIRASADIAASCMSSSIQSARLTVVPGSSAFGNAGLTAVAAPLPVRGHYGMAGESAAMERLYTQIERIGPHFRTALVLGETGTGKEMVARALHGLSPAASGPFVVCNASAIVETLFESEVFGHVKGAFTGAMTDRTGLFESAHQGTLFLDEIGEMPMSTQAKLLRTLQSHEIQRVGSSALRKVEVRIIAATNRDLRALAASGQFRQDLYYRIAMVEILLPPLRQRMGDLPLLTEYLLQKLAAQYGKQMPTLHPEAMRILEQHGWPGNVRELENVLGTAMLQSQSSVIVAEDLPNLKKPMPMNTVARANQEFQRLDEIIEQHVLKVLEQCTGNKLRAADMLGISRSTLYRMLDTYISKSKSSR